VINGIRIFFAEAPDAFIFAEHRAEHSLSTITLSSRIAKGRDTLKLIVVKHRYLSLASPTPGHFHRWLTVTAYQCEYWHAKFQLSRICHRQPPV
jgi:hypothetical protein